MMKPLFFLIFGPISGQCLRSSSSSNFHNVSIPGKASTISPRAVGDISIVLPGDIAETVKTFLSEDNSCPNLGSTQLKQKRVPGDIIGCLVADAEDILDSMGAGNPLAALFDNAQQGGAIQLPPEIASFADDGVVEALSSVLAHAAETLPHSRPTISSDTAQAMGLLAFYITYFFVFTTARTLTQILIQGPDLGTRVNNCIVGWKPRCEGSLCVGVDAVCTANAYFRGCPCDPYPCPKPYEHSLLCSLDCGGADADGKCKGTESGDWKGCDCIQPWDSPFFSAVEHGYQDITDILAALPDINSVDESPITTCKENTGAAWTYGPAAELYVKQFCANSANLNGKKGAQAVQQFGVASLDEDLTITAILTDSEGSNDVVVSEGDCFSNLWNILNCPRVATNFYGGKTQIAGGGTTFEMIPHGGTPVFTCDPPDPPLIAGDPWSYKVALKRDGMVSAYTDFCETNSNVSITAGKLQKIYGPLGGAEVEGHQNIRVSAQPANVGPTSTIPEACRQWDGTLGKFQCLEVFKALTDKCDTSTLIGKRGGYSAFQCVEWHIDGWQRTADMYRLHLHQQMVDKFSQIEWTLFDSQGTLVAGPSTEPTVTGAPQELDIKVDSPTNKDKTNVRLFYPKGGKFQWSTGSTGKAGSAVYNAEYYCDDILSGGPGSWSGWQSGGRNGFERQFDCVFRGWKGNFGGTI